MNFCQKQNQKVLKRVLQSFMKLTTKKYWHFKRLKKGTYKTNNKQGVFY